MHTVHQQLQAIRPTAQQVEQALVWPYLEPGMSGNKRELIVFNKGVGPAIVQGVQIFVDGKPQHNWSEVFGALGLNYEHIPYSTLNGVVISPNDHIDQLLFENADDFNRFTRQMKRVHMKLCYCSSLGDCWLFDDAASGGMQSHQPVARCEIPRADQFLDNENAEPAQPAPVPAKENKS